MKINAQPQTSFGKDSSLVCIAILLATGFCLGQSAISLSPTSGPPTTNLRVSGSGFTPYAKVDVYFGTKDEALATANAKGSFAGITISVPASALPGTHPVKAIERSDNASAQANFLVRTNWSEFHRENMRRWNPYENVLSVKTVPNLELKWSYTATDLMHSPALANGVVYVGSNDHNVYALKAGTGALLWSHATGGAVGATPAVANGIVYISSDKMYALKANTGALLWSYAISGSSPTVANGVVYFASDDHNVYALDARTGAKLWSHYTGCDASFSPAVADGIVYIGTTDISNKDTKMYALNANTGAKLWTYNIGYDMGRIASPAVADGTVYFGAFQSMWALNARTGALVWSSNTDWMYSPAVANGVVFAVGGKFWDVFAFDTRTGQSRLLYDTVNGFSALAVANGVIYVGVEAAGIIALNASNGAVLWEHNFDNGVDISDPIVANGVVYFSFANSINAFGLK